MTARNYDVVITVDNATGFQSTNVLIGNTSAAVGVIANVNTTLNTLKVKLSNSIAEFSNLEVVHSNVISISGSANGLLNTTSLPFQSNTLSGNTTTAIAIHKDKIRAVRAPLLAALDVEYQRAQEVGSATTACVAK